MLWCLTNDHCIDKLCVQFCFDTIIPNVFMLFAYICLINVKTTIPIPILKIL